MTAHQLPHHDDAGDQLRHMLAELTRPHRHRERYHVDRGVTSWSKFHHTKVPPLLQQLETAIPTSTGDSPSSGGGFRSQPAAHLESLDALAAIDREASRWIKDLGEDDPDDTIGCVQLLGALAASAHRCHRRTAARDKTTRKVTCCTWHAISVDVKRWWTQARIVTGWESPAWRPDNTCPACDQRGGLRVRLLDQSAMCIECRETWDRATIGLLAEHIRLENFDQVVSEEDPDESADLARPAANVDQRNP